MASAGVAGLGSLDAAGILVLLLRLRADDSLRRQVGIGQGQMVPVDIVAIVRKEDIEINFYTPAHSPERIYSGRIRITESGYGEFIQVQIDVRIMIITVISISRWKADNGGLLMTGKAKVKIRAVVLLGSAGKDHGKFQSVSIRLPGSVISLSPLFIDNMGL